jgi:tetratricopeptide (TPR) repeat protein
VGRGREAVELARQALEMKRLALSPGDEGLVYGLFSLGRALRVDGRQEEAVAVHQEAVDFCLEYLGEGRTLSITAISSLGRAHFEAGDLDQAERYLAQTLDLSRRHLGPVARDTMLATRDLADLLIRRERHGEALSTIQRQLDDCAGQVDEDDAVLQRLIQKADLCRSKLGTN